MQVTELHGKVGVAPGTTTLTVPSGPYPMQLQGSDAPALWVTGLIFFGGVVATVLYVRHERQSEARVSREIAYRTLRKRAAQGRRCDRIYWDCVGQGLPNSPCRDMEKRCRYVRRRAPAAARTR